MADENNKVESNYCNKQSAVMFHIGDCQEASDDLSTICNGQLSTVLPIPEARRPPCLIGVAGGTASGKSTVCKKIIEALAENSSDKNIRRRVEIISQECFYRALTDSEKLLAAKGQFNFDHPDAFDEKEMIRTLSCILAGHPVKVTEYDFLNHCPDARRIRTIKPADVILFEGILIFYFKKVRDMFSMKLFVDTDPDTRLARRVECDMKQRGRPLDQILQQYILYVKPAFEEFCLPTKKYADVIIPRGADNLVAIDLIVQHIQDLLRHGTAPDITYSSSSSLHSVDSTSSFKMPEDPKYSSVH